LRTLGVVSDQLLQAAQHEADLLDHPVIGLEHLTRSRAGGGEGVAAPAGPGHDNLRILRGRSWRVQRNFSEAHAW